MSAAPYTFYADAPPQARARLLAQARKGNPEAFAEMVSPYMPTLYRRARGLTGNAADAQDVSQETVLKAWSRLGQFAGKQDDPIDDFRAWISRIAANTSIDLLRQRRDGKIASLDQCKGESDCATPTGPAAGLFASRRPSLFDARSRRPPGNIRSGCPVAVIPRAPPAAGKASRRSAARYPPEQSPHLGIRAAKRGRICSPGYAGIRGRRLVIP